MKNLILATAFAILVTSAHAFAYVPGVWDPQPQMYNANQPAFIPLAMSNPVYNPAPTPAPTPAPVVIHPKPAPTVTPTSAPVQQSQQPQYAYPATNQNNNLGASAGNTGFMPHTFGQWLLVIFLILVVIIVARQLKKKPEHEEDNHGNASVGAH